MKVRIADSGFNFVNKVAFFELSWQSSPLARVWLMGYRVMMRPESRRLGKS